MRKLQQAVSTLVCCTLALLFVRQGSSAQTNAPPPGRFVHLPEKLGVYFKQEASPTSRKYLLETMGSGVALFDYDNDGPLAWPHKKSSLGRTNTSIRENAIASTSIGA